jgi:hypothetical protein
MGDPDSVAFLILPLVAATGLARALATSSATLNQSAASWFNLEEVLQKVTTFTAAVRTNSITGLPSDNFLIMTSYVVASLLRDTAIVA